MRKILLASAAVLGAASWLNQANAQPTAMAMMPTQGMVAGTPSASPPAGANNNNNTNAKANPGAVANPTPGTVVIHVNGRVTTGLYETWSNLDKGTFPAVTGVGGATLAPAGNYKVQPSNIATYARIYTGLDAMAANGLRYGGAIEIRENFTGQSSSSASTGASGYSSSQTLFVRRAFVYVAADNIGIVRAGQGDGLISLYDNGVTTFQFLPSGNLNGGDLETVVMGNTTIPFVFLGVAGNEYDNNKFVYMSPQFAGFDFGFQWAPNTSNGYGTGSPNTYGTVAGCSYAGPGCPGLTSSSGSATDGARIINQTAVGVRYQGSFSGLGVLAYGVYEFSGKANYTPVTAAAKAAGPYYNNLGVGNFGVALTYAGFTVGGNYIGGSMNGQGALKPAGGANMNAFTVGVTYKTGPLLVGIVGENIQSQGAVPLAGITQRSEKAIDAGASYTIAPGLVAWTEYMYQTRKQSGFNFATGSVGSAYNNVQSQGFEVGTTVYW